MGPLSKTTACQAGRVPAAAAAASLKFPLALAYVTPSRASIGPTREGYYYYYDFYLRLKHRSLAHIAN